MSLTDAAPAPGRRAATRQANRAALLAAAREVFVELGYGAASVRDVVRRSGLASGTFYNYFPDKEAVLRALVEERAEEIRVRVRAARQQARTPEELVGAGYRAYFEELARDRPLLELLRRNAGTIRTLFDTPALGAGAAELEADLRAGVAAGLLPAHDARRMAAAMVGAGLELALRTLDEDPPDVAGAAAFATSLFVAALGVAPPGGGGGGGGARS